MASQEQQRPSKREREDHDVDPEPLPGGGATYVTKSAEVGVEGLLDEIDDVLESNAEQFVRQYTQKGGQ